MEHSLFPVLARPPSPLVPMAKTSQEGLITSKDVKVNTMISLDNEYFPESNSTHCPLLMQITVKGRGEQEGKESP